MRPVESVTLRETAVAIDEMLLRCFGLPCMQEMGPFRGDRFNIWYEWYDHGWRVTAAQDVLMQRVHIKVQTRGHTYEFSRNIQ